ncbi:MAG: S9 family peptidase [Actinomycetes bacterium]
MRPEDLQLLYTCGVPSLAPDGSFAVVPILHPDLETDDYSGSLWLAPTDGAAPPTPLTRGHRDTAPAVSADGRWLAFLRAEHKGKPQIHVLPLGGGEPLRVTDHANGAGAPRWSPDSRRIAYAARVPEEGRYGTDPDVSPDAEPPRLVTRLSYRADGLGFVLDRPQHLFVLDLGDFLTSSVDALDLDADAVHEALVPRQLTDGDFDDAAPAWSPDGEAVAFVSDRHETRDVDLRRHAYVVRAEGGEPRQVTTGDLSVGEVAWATDGERLLLLGTETGPKGTDLVAANTGAFVVSVGADPDVPVRLTDVESIDLGDVGSQLSVTTRGVVVQDRARGGVRLLELDPDDGAVDADSVRELAGGHVLYRAQAATPDGSVVVAVAFTPDSAGDLVVVRSPDVGPDDEPRRLTDVSRQLRAAGIRPLREITVTADDRYPVHGWLVLPDPERFGSGPHPVLLNIHGGPFAAYGWGLFDEAQVYAGAGYAVLMCNPRGSGGYGEAHGRAILGAFGDRDSADILQFLDGALAAEPAALDHQHLGVMGGSYGGYMTAWLTTRTQRFAAAIVERGYLDATSFVGSSDIGWFFAEACHGSPEAMREQSPLTYVDRVRTPTLVIHSENDWRTPVEQGQRWFTALKLQGVECELLLFPGEGHELSRSGRPKHRLARFQHILRWWAKYLPVSDPDAA